MRRQERRGERRERIADRILRMAEACESAAPPGVSRFSIRQIAGIYRVPLRLLVTVPSRHAARWTALTTALTGRPTSSSDGDTDRLSELEVARPAGLEPTTFRSAT